MKCSKLVFLTASIIALSLGGNCVMAGQISEQENITQFQYPVRPGMEEWGKLNHAERVLASQIPDNKLGSMKTEELIDVVLDYPCFVDMIFYDTYQEGFETVRDHFNGLEELLTRDDAGSLLLDRYRNEDVLEPLTLSDSYEQFKKFLNFAYLETIMAQPEVIDKLTADELEELCQLVDENYELCLENSNNPVFSSCSAYYQVLAEQQNIEPLDSVSYVYTPNGSAVEVITRTGTDTTYAQRDLYKLVTENDYPGAVVVGDATIKYNCHAYAWARRTNVWMNYPTKYWSDGSYTLKSSNAPTAINQRAYYPGSGNEHSGLVIRLSGNEICSKWSDGCLVEHDVYNCPYFYTPLSIKFYGR